MAKLPVVSGKDLIKALKKNGFQVVRQKGSHVSYKEEPTEQLSHCILNSPMEPCSASSNNADFPKGNLSDLLEE